MGMTQGMNQKTDNQPQRILAIDDDRSVLEVVKASLEMGGFEVLASRDPREAVLLYSQQWRDIDLVVLDYRMPEMSGAAVFDALRQVNPDTKVLLLTGSGEETAREMLVRGVRAYVSKPFYVENLLQKAREIIAAP